MSTATAHHEHLWFLDTLVSFPVAHADGADGMSVMESRKPYGESPPLHVHHAEDELFHVLEGELRVRIGESDVRVRAGETVLAPQGVPHTYRVESPEGATTLVMTTKGGFEGMVRAVARPAERPELPESSGPPTEEQVAALAEAAAANGIELLGPPLTAES